MEISQEAIDLIIAWEVAGGDRSAARSAYDREHHRPHWPGNVESGLTIGIGYDLRFSKAWFEGDWKTRLDALPRLKDAYKRLSAYLGRGGSIEAVRATSDISIPWEDAIAVYRVRRLPHYIEEAKLAFPGVDAMGPHVWGVLTSVVYNCGRAVSGKSRVLKRAAYEQIRKAVAEKSVAGVAAGIRALKAYHELKPKVRRGLQRRREAEAQLLETTAAARPAA